MMVFASSFCVLFRKVFSCLTFDIKSNIHELFSKSFTLFSVVLSMCKVSNFENVWYIVNVLGKTKEKSTHFSVEKREHYENKFPGMKCYPNRFYVIGMYWVKAHYFIIVFDISEEVSHFSDGKANKIMYTFKTITHKPHTETTTYSS